MAVMSLDSLPLGFRFHPKNEELVNHYLRSKINGMNSVDSVIREVDICKHEPWDLPHLSVIKSDDKEWFFFTHPVHKYPNSCRKKRATKAGFWKTTGRDQTIKASKSGMKPIGKRKTLVFYEGRAPGKKTSWKIHEYRATEEELDGTKPGQSPFVLCHLFWMPDKKTKNSSSDEAEPSGSSSTATKSLSKDTPVDQSLVQETPDVIEKWLADNLDNVPPERELEVRATELEEEFRRLIYEYEPVKPFSPLQTEMQIGEYPVTDSTFTKDFGYDISDSMFPNGSNDQDSSTTEKSLASLINYNYDENSFEESTSQKTSVVETEEGHPEISVGQSFLQGPVFQKDNGSSTDTDTEVEKKQDDPVMGDSWCINEYTNTNMEDSIELQGAKISDGLIGTGIKISAYQQGGTGIKIGAYQQQGRAPRRIRLQREAICNLEDDESKPEVIEAGEVSLETFTKLKCRKLERHGVIESKQKSNSPCVLAEASPARPGSRFLSGYIVSVALVIILFMLFIGVWRYFNS